MHCKPSMRNLHWAVAPSWVSKIGCKEGIAKACAMTMDAEGCQPELFHVEAHISVNT